MSKSSTKVKRKYNRTYLRKGDHAFILISIFLTRVKYQGWNDGQIKKVLKEATSKDYEYLYFTLKMSLDKENI
ncbi:hypothetical protein F7P82_11650 [Acinetobacter guillouiae]|nr:hypothetical protein F7P82_11650 [Acinetobacter guillouiae]